MKKKIIVIILVIIFIVSGSITGFTLYDYYCGESYTTGSVHTDSSREVALQTEQEEELSPLERANQQKPLSENAIGWLRIEDADIDDPVLQAEDNEFYLSHDDYDEYSIWGSYFFSCDNNTSPEALDKVTLIFGHSNGNSAHLKFSTLKKFKDVEFAQNHQYIELWVGDTKTIWQVFSACDYPVAEHTIMNVNPNDSAFQEEIARMKKLSYNHYDVPVSEDDNVLVLATCSGEDNYDYRFLVCAKRVQ